MEDLGLALQRLEELQKDLYSDVVIREEEGHWVRPHIQTWDSSAGAASNSDEIEEWCEANKKWVIEPRITKADVARTELQKIYKSSYINEARKVAGRILGYSDFRIWVHEVIRR